MEEMEAVETVNLEKVLGYIQEREGNLARASEKLRKNVERIANVFGNPNTCMMCNEDKRNACHHRYMDRRNHKGYDKIPEVPSDVIEHRYHKFVPKIYVSIDIVDDRRFYDEVNYDLREIYTLHIGGGGMDVVISNVEDEDDVDYIQIKHLSRKAVKELVKSGRISKFLQKVAEKLEAGRKEYEETAEVAERLAAALP